MTFDPVATVSHFPPMPCRLLDAAGAVVAELPDGGYALHVMYNDLIDEQRVVRWFELCGALRHPDGTRYISVYREQTTPEPRCNRCGQREDHPDHDVPR